MELKHDNSIEKLTLLFVLEKMEIPLTETNIIDIIMDIVANMPSEEKDRFSYLYLKEAMFQLIEVNFICENKIENEDTRYTITVDGRNCLSHFYFRIPKDIRERITQYAKDNRMNFKRRQEYVSEYEKNPDGSYSVLLKIKEPILTNTLLQIKLKAPNRQSAVEATKKWSEKAPAIYESIYDNLLDI